MRSTQDVYLANRGSVVDQRKIALGQFRFLAEISPKLTLHISCPRFVPLVGFVCLQQPRDRLYVACLPPSRRGTVRLPRCTGVGPVLCCLSRNSSKKGVTTLLDAFDRLPETLNFHLLLVGDIDGSKE